MRRTAILSILAVAIAAGPLLAHADETATSDSASSDSFRYEAHWLAQNDSGRHSAAVETATSWINDAIVQFGEGSAETFTPFVRKAQSLDRAGRLLESIEAYEDAIRIGERQFGAVSMVLVAPLTELGMIHQRELNDEAALRVLLRAKDITHRNAGIFNLEQEPIVDRLTESFMNTGDQRQAAREQRFLYGAAKRTYGDDNINFVPALKKWASFNARLRQYTAARKLYEKAVDIQAATYGEDDLRIAETLTEMAREYAGKTVEDGVVPPREGVRALERAVQIYASQDYVDDADLMVAYSRLGDWHLMHNRIRKKGLDVYQKAIDDALAKGVDKLTVDRVFGAPRILGSMIGQVAITPAQRAAMQGQRRHIVYEYDLNARGEVKNIRLVEDQLNAVMARRLLRDQIKKSFHRPRWVNGRAVPTFGMRMYIYFDPDRSEPIVLSSTPQSDSMDVQEAANADDLADP